MVAPASPRDPHAGPPTHGEPVGGEPVSRVPGRLRAPEPGWTTSADVVVVGSGIAGLTAALRLRGQVDTIMVVTKDVLAAGSTQWAQGGIAAALGPGDTPAEHEVGHAGRRRRGCDLEAVRALVDRGSRRRPRADRPRRHLRPRARRGALADPRGRPPPRPDRPRRRRRHRRGDPAGAHRRGRARAPEIEVIQHALAVDLLLADDGGVAGVTLHVMGEGQRDGVGAVHCRAVVLASGGLGQVFSADHQPGGLHR